MTYIHRKHSAIYYVTGEGYALLPNVDMCKGCSAQQEYGAVFSKNSVFASCRIILLSRVCINSRPSRRPSVKVVNQNRSVQLGEKAAEYYL